MSPFDKTGRLLDVGHGSKTVRVYFVAALREPKSKKNRTL